MKKAKKIKRKSRPVAESHVTVNLDRTKYEVVRECAEISGWHETSSTQKCLVFWADASGTIDFASRLQRWQFYNHFPGMGVIAHKVALSRTLSRMLRAYPVFYDFHPQTFVLPHHKTELKNSMSFNSKVEKGNKLLANFSNTTNKNNIGNNNKTTNNNENNKNNRDDLNIHENHNNNKNNNNTIRNSNIKTFIIKPDKGSQGKGIQLVQDASVVDGYYDNAVAQEYIEPFLINNLKFDLRIYVLVTSVSPLRVYVHKQGMARFCTEPYESPNNKNLDNAYSHLTNFSLNKSNANFEVLEEGGHKRSLESVFKDISDMGVNVEEIWAKIEDIIRLTLIAAQPELSAHYHTALNVNDGKSRCFEILGFDILLDQNAKPYLLEVNCMPSLQNGSDFDTKLKKTVVLETMKILAIPPNFKKLCMNHFKQISMHRAGNVKPLFDPKKESEIALETHWKQLIPVPASNENDSNYKDIVEMLSIITSKRKLNNNCAPTPLINNHNNNNNNSNSVNNKVTASNGNTSSLNNNANSNNISNTNTNNTNTNTNNNNNNNNTTNNNNEIQVNNEGSNGVNQNLEDINLFTKSTSNLASDNVNPYAPCIIPRYAQKLPRPAQTPQPQHLRHVTQNLLKKPNVKNPNYMVKAPKALIMANEARNLKIVAQEKRTKLLDSVPFHSIFKGITPSPVIPSEEKERLRILNAQKNNPVCSNILYSIHNFIRENGYTKNVQVSQGNPSKPQMYMKISTSTSSNYVRKFVV